jgi:hypothetical protein
MGVFIDADLHGHALPRGSLGDVLRQLRQVRRYLPPSTFQMLVAALVLTRLDYANSILAGLPVHLVRRLHAVGPQRRCAAHLYGLRRCDHVTDALLMLHWTKVRERIQFKLPVLVHRVLHGTAPSYLGPLSRVADSRTSQGGAPSGRRLPHNSSFLQFACRPSALVLLRSLAPRSGTVCQLILPLLTVFPPSDVA